MTSSSAASDLESTPTARAKGGISGRAAARGLRHGIQGERSGNRSGRFGEVAKKEDREADRTGSGSSEKAPQEIDPESDSVDDARRLYVKNQSLVRTQCELKKAGETTERRKAPRLSDRGFSGLFEGEGGSGYTSVAREGKRDHRPTRDPLGKPLLPLIRRTFA